MIKINNKWFRRMWLLVVLAATVSCYADFDADNAADMFLVLNGGQTSWFESDGTDNTVTSVLNVGPSTSTAVAAGDIDGDTNFDILIGTAGGNLQWYETNGDDSKVFVRGDFGSGAVANGIVIADIDGDGNGDIIMVDSSGAVIWYESETDNAAGYVKDIVASGIIAIATGDLDGDIYSDLFAAGTAGLDWYEVIGDDTVSLVGQIPLLANAKAIAVGNVDGDANGDLLVVDANGIVHWLEANGDDVIPVEVTTFGTGVVSVEIVDIDADGVNEVLCASGVNVIYFEASADDTIGQVKIQAHAANVLDVKALGFTRSNMTLPVKIYTRTIFKTTDGNDLNFPQFAVAENGRLVMKYSEGTHVGSETYNMLSSDDWGWSWSDYSGPPVDPYCHGLIESSLGTGAVFSIGYTSVTLPDTSTLRIGFYKTWEGLTHGTYIRALLTYPFTVGSFYGHGNVILLEDGTILATGYGQPDGTVGASQLIASTDEGLTWNYRASMIDTPGSEPSLVLLNNGNLLCVSRGEPLRYAISTDDGYTWSTPITFGFNGVDPRLIKLDDGRIVLSYGRPNVYMMIADENGGNWSSPIPIYIGPGSAYTGLAKTADGDIILAYSESDFGGEELPGDENYIKMTKIAVIPCEGGYLDADLNFDCKVDNKDYALMAQQWLVN